MKLGIKSLKWSTRRPGILVGLSGGVRLDIKVGPLGSETTFHYVNVNPERIKPSSEHLTIIGTTKFQEASIAHNEYSFEFVYLTLAERNSLKTIFDLSDVLNVQLEEESFGIDHSFKFRSPLSTWRSRRIPSGYEATIVGVEV